MYSQYHDAPHDKAIQTNATHVDSRGRVLGSLYRNRFTVRPYRNRVNENICRPCTPFGWSNPQLGEMVREGV